MTPEHIPPNWYEEYIARFSPPEGRRINLNGVPIGNRQYRLRANTTVEICKPCNGALNTYVENPARELIKQLVIAARSLEELTPAEQASAARWMAKDAMMIALAFDHATPIHALAALVSNGELPPRMTVWLGQTEDAVVKGAAAQNLRSKPELVETFPVPWGCFTGYPRHWRLRALIVDDPGDAYWPVELPVELSGLFVRVWPTHEGVIDWPPPIIHDRPTDDAINSVFRFVIPFDDAAENPTQNPT